MLGLPGVSNLEKSRQLNSLVIKYANTYDDWGEKEIDERQAWLAKIAVKTWPV